MKSISQYYTLYHAKRLLGVGAVHVFGNKAVLYCQLQDGRMARGWFDSVDEALGMLGEVFGGADAVDAYEVDFISYDNAKHALIVQPAKQRKPQKGRRS